MATNYTSVPKIYHDNKTYQYLSLQESPKFNHIGLFGLKIYHLATLNGVNSISCDLYLNSANTVTVKTTRINALDLLVSSDSNSGLRSNQGDQIGWIFACWAIVHFGKFF
jgi:hypothetical protein